MTLKLEMVDDPKNWLWTTEREWNTVKYTPKDDYCDAIYGDYYTTQYTYTISDESDDRLSASATVYIKAKCKRNKPIARNDEDEINEGVSVDVTTLDNDSDPDNEDDPNTVAIDQVGQPQVLVGSTTTVNDDGTVTYTPGDNCDNVASSSTYTDTFSCTMTDLDENMLSDPATVTITVTCDPRPPLAGDDSVSTPEDTPLTIGVLQNDADPEQEPLRVNEIVAAVLNDADNTFTCTVNPEFCDLHMKL